MERWSLQKCAAAENATHSEPPVSPGNSAMRENMQLLRISPDVSCCYESVDLVAFFQLIAPFCVHLGRFRCITILNFSVVLENTVRWIQDERREGPQVSHLGLAQPVHRSSPYYKLQAVHDRSSMLLLFVPVIKNMVQTYRSLESPVKPNISTAMNKVSCLLRNEQFLHRL